MKKDETINKYEIHILSDKQVIAADNPGTRILEISINSPKIIHHKARAPLNLSLVLDRSGSMDGEKLTYVKQAAAHVVDLLDDKDRLSVTVYDDTVETIAPTDFMTNENKILAKNHIKRISSGSSTFLSGGWLRGCEEVAKGSTDSTINRTLLLTDGLANVGIRNDDELSYHAREIYLRGVATSCFGVGLGYNEHLLEAMANFGGGNFHFLETTNAIPLVFEREFKELVNISLRDTELSVHLPPGVTAEVCAGWPAEMVNDRFNISIGSLYAGKNQTIYLTLHFAGDIKASELPLSITLRGKGDEDFLNEENASFSFKVVSSKHEQAVEIDQSLMERFALVDMADKANEALKRERVGDRAGAARMMNNAILEHREHLSPSMIHKFDYMSNEMKDGMNDGVRKRLHREQYENRRGQEIIRDYRLQYVNGHLITEIEGQSVLIDTGVPISVGAQEEWYFLHEVYKLSQDYMGVTVDYLSKMVGAKVDILLGADILDRYHITIDLFKNRISFSFRTLFLFDHWIPFIKFMGAPIATATIAGNSCQVFIDTGAKLSYVDQKIASKFSPVGKEKDFYPGMGEFETVVYEIPFQLGPSTYTLRCGILPPLLETTLLVTGKSGIIGSELYQKSLVDLAFPQSRIYLNNPQ